MAGSTIILRTRHRRRIRDGNDWTMISGFLCLNSHLDLEFLLFLCRMRNGHLAEMLQVEDTASGIAAHRHCATLCRHVQGSKRHAHGDWPLLGCFCSCWNYVSLKTAHMDLRGECLGFWTKDFDGCTDNPCRHPRSPHGEQRELPVRQ